MSRSARRPTRLPARRPTHVPTSARFAHPRAAALILSAALAAPALVSSRTFAQDPPVPDAPAQPTDSAPGDGALIQVDPATPRTEPPADAPVPPPADAPADTTVTVTETPPGETQARVEAEVETDDTRPDKSQYTLTNPTPPELMRPLSADRPDVTETPYTVDAGHFQVELSFFETARNGDGAITEFDLLPFVAKVGLTNSIDLELGVVPYVNLDIDDLGPFDDDGGDSGFGPITLRAKFNLWGNDGGGAPFDLPDNFPTNLRERWGDSAFALIPYIRFPTGEEDLGFSNDVKFGVAAPLSTPLTKDWDLGLMIDLGVVRGPDDGSYKLDFLHTASFARNLGGNLGGYAEYIGEFSGSGGTEYLASLGFGVTYGLSRNAQLDAAINVGLNEEAEDLRFLTGLTWRR